MNGLRTTNGNPSSPPYRNGPYLWDQDVTISGGLNGTIKGKAGKCYYVDEENGADGNNGLSPSTAFATLYKCLGNTTGNKVCRDDYSDDAEYHIYIAPGSYDSADLRMYGHGIHLHGLGIAGSDSGVNLIDTNCTSAPLLLAGANCTIENICFLMTDATDSAKGGIYAIAADNCIIRNCTFKCVSGAGTNGILIEDMRNSKVYGNNFGDAGSFFVSNIHGSTGADKYLIHTHIAGNRIYSTRAASKGIVIHGDCLCYGTVIERNFINLGKATGAAIGIDQNNTNVALITDNFVCMASGDVPIESASSPTGMIGNHTQAGGTVVDPNTVAS